MKRASAPGLLGKLGDPRLRLALEILSRKASLRAEGLYLVGGCVRDLLLGRRLRDLDLVVEGDPSGLAREAAAEMGGEAHGPSPFLTCRIEGPAGLRIDIAMSRRERYRSAAALPEVSPAPIEEDLLRRDFTMNSLAIVLTGPSRGRLLDPSGGLKDLRSGCLQIHHRLSLVDDPTRAFRAARYAARYGFFMSRGWKASLDVAARRGAFRRLTPSRLGREIVLLFGEPDPLEAAARAARWGLLEMIDPALHWRPDLRADLDRALRSKRGERPRVERLCLALLVRAAPARWRRRVARRVGLAGAAAQEAVRAAGAIEEFRTGSRSVAGSSNLEGRLLLISRTDPLSLAVILASAPPGMVREAEDLSRKWAASRPHLTGEEVLALGVGPGPAMGRALRELRMRRAAGRIRSRADEIRYVRALVSRAAREG